MNRIIISLTALAISTGVAKAAEEAPLPPIEPVLENTLTGYIRPGYAALDDAASELKSSMDALCSAPSETNLQSARIAFRASVESWARMEWLRLGPVMSENRLERILFFPDRKGTGRKQVQAAIATKSENVTEVDVLA